MRPRGEIRALLGAKLGDLVLEQGPLNYRQLAEATQVGYEATRRTLDNMVEAGEVRVAGKERPAGERHWLNLYEPADDDEPKPWGGIEALADTMRGFATAAVSAAAAASGFGELFDPPGDPAS